MREASPLQEAACDPGNLAAAFNRYKRYRGLWAPGLLMSDVQTAPVLPILRLAEDLFNGRYRPTPPHRISIAKAAGGRRELRVYAIRDRVAQRALLQPLQALTNHAMSPCSFGYRQGRGVHDAVQMVRNFLDDGLRWVVDADIERCFDTIPRAPLLAEVARRVDDDKAASLVARYLGWNTRDQRSGIGIPQGSVLAPWLCNIYLWQIDDYMQERGMALVRFADDFLLPVASRAAAHKTRDACAELLETMRLRLHALKTGIAGPSMKFRFLGQWLQIPPEPHDMPRPPENIPCC